MFPTPTATALTIRSMHAGAAGSAIALKKLKGLGIAFISAIVHRVASYYAIGVCVCGDPEAAPATKVTTQHGLTWDRSCMTTTSSPGSIYGHIIPAGP
jgi:hypothetical protein